MEVDVGKEWANDATLWRAEPRVLEQLPLHDARTEELPDQVEELLVLDAAPQELHQLPVVDRVERSLVLMPASRTRRRTRSRSRIRPTPSSGSASPFAPGANPPASLALPTSPTRRP